MQVGNDTNVTQTWHIFTSEKSFSNRTKYTPNGHEVLLI